MDHQLTVGVFDGRTNEQKSLEALANAEILAVAPGVERQAVDKLHHEVRGAILQHASIEQAGYAWVIQGGKNLTFIDEPPDIAVGEQAGMEQLDGRALVVLVVGATR